MCQKRSKIARGEGTTYPSVSYIADAGGGPGGGGEGSVVFVEGYEVLVCGVGWTGVVEVGPEAFDEVGHCVVGHWVDFAHDALGWWVAEAW